MTVGQDENLSSIKLHGTIIQCVYLKSNGGILYSLDDVLKLLFSKVNWSLDVKWRKKYSYVKSLQNFSIFLRYCIVDKLPIPFFTNRGVTYFINDLILRHQYPIIDIDALPKFTTDVIQKPLKSVPILLMIMLYYQNLIIFLVKALRIFQKTQILKSKCLNIIARDWD